MSFMPNFSRAAMWAGHKARHSLHSSCVAHEPISSAERHATVLAEKYTGATAEQWIMHVSTEGNHLWSEALGAGTPLVFTYLLGWTVGKSNCGLLVALAFALSSWGAFLSLSLGDDTIMSGVEMWALVVTMAVLSFSLFYVRVRKRIPQGTDLSPDEWRAICLETVLAKTAMCVFGGGILKVARAAVASPDTASAAQAGGASQFAVSAAQAGGASQFAVSVATFSAPFVFWCAMQRAVQGRQHTFLKENHLAVRANKEDRSTPSTWHIERARTLFNAAFMRSKDLRMIGLCRAELLRLADLFAYGGTRACHEAELIYFCTRKVELTEKRSLQRAFNQGYEYILRRDYCNGGGCDDASGTRRWIHRLLEEVDSSTESPLTSIPKLLAEEAPLHVNFPWPRKKRAQLWWFFGAMAKFSDVIDAVPLPRPASPDNKLVENNESYRWYALFAAALHVNRNPSAAIRAMETGNLLDRSLLDTAAVDMSAEEMSRKMKIGCEQVLRQAATPAEAGDLYVKERGLVLTAAASGGSDSPRTVTYSAGEVWQAELAREPVMIGQDTLDSLWEARKSRALSLSSKEKLWRDNMNWSSNVVARVDFKDTLAFLATGSEEVADPLAAAWRGWFLHSVWAVCTVGMQLVLPHHVPALTFLALVFLQICKDDQHAHFLFVATHLWRFSFMGRACLPLDPMSDADINDMAWYSFMASVVVINVGSAACGQVLVEPLCAAACVFLLLISIAPGFWFFFWGGKKHVEGSGITVVYCGRSRGEGYEHRDDPDNSRRVGRDVLSTTFRENDDACPA